MQKEKARERQIRYIGKRAITTDEKEIAYIKDNRNVDVIMGKSLYFNEIWWSKIFMGSLGKGNVEWKRYQIIKTCSFYDDHSSELSRRAYEFNDIGKSFHINCHPSHLILIIMNFHHLNNLMLQCRQIQTVVLLLYSMILCVWFYRLDISLWV